MIRITNIERFATHDGPGIRTTFFFKGCMLHCPWCSNPETWNSSPVLLHDAKKCTSCGLCEKACANGAIRLVNGQWTYDRHKCRVCRRCEAECLNDAISFSGNDYTVSELVTIAKKDLDFYEESQGGVTLSGGEVFMQFEGLRELVHALKKEGLHVALETTGCYSNEKLKEIADEIDLFLMDLKHTDAEKLYEATGADGQLVMDNFRYLADHYPEKIILRMPVIPRFNDDEETILSVLDFAAQTGIAEVDLLPFHPLGKSKWIQMGRRYAYENDKMMDKENLYPYIQIGKEKGIQVKVGG